MFVLFMVAIFVNYRMGYREGIYGGHQYGVYETVSWLVDRGYMSGTHTETGEKVSVKDLTHKVLAELELRRPELTYDDMK